MLHPDLLRSFLAVVDAGSFTAAGAALGLRQSTISQHVARLETALGRTLLARDTHRLALTPDGDALVGFARRVMDAHGRLEGFFSDAALRGSIRLGTSEDFTLSALPEALGRFAARHSSVDLQLTVGLSGVLYQAYDAGELDVIFVKRRRGDTRGRVAWREQLAWVARPGYVPDPSLALPLVLYPQPSITRGLAIAALEEAGRSWRVACTSGSLSGLRAAAEAGLGVAPHSGRLVPPGLAILPDGDGLPALGSIEFVIIGPGAHHTVAAALIDTILASVAGMGG
jgi:DNA-binding transcriptional LysR family regulator